MTQYEEGPWVTKRNGIYYAVYPAGGVPEYMAYSTAPSVHGPWTFKGRIMNEAENSFTIHGGNIHFKGHDYMFYTMVPCLMVEDSNALLLLRSSSSMLMVQYLSFHSLKRV